MKNYALRQAMDLFRSGNRKEAEALFESLTEQEPHNELAWLWLAASRDTDAEKLKCIQTVLSINPNNQKAVDILRRLSLEGPPARSFEKTTAPATLDELADMPEDNEPYERMYHRVVDAVLADNSEQELDAEIRSSLTPAARQPVIKPVPQPVPTQPERRRFNSPFQSVQGTQAPRTTASVDPASERLPTRTSLAAAEVQHSKPTRSLSKWLTLALLVVLVFGQMWSILRINQLEDRLQLAAEKLNAVQMELIVVNQLLDRD